MVMIPSPPTGRARWRPYLLDANLRHAGATAFVALAALLTLVTLAVGLRATSGGMGRVGDGVTYFGVARNIVDGRGISQPFVNEYDGIAPADGARLVGQSPLLLWPPLYPVVLAGGATAGGMDLPDAARLVNVASLLVLVIGTSYLAWRMSRGALVSALVAGVLVLFAANVQLLVTVFCSDLLAAALALPVLLVLPRAAREGGALDLAVVWVLLTLACLVRLQYAGWSVTLAFGLVVLGSRRPRPRLRRDAVIVASSIVPLAVWRVIVSRQVATHVPALSLYPEWTSRLSAPFDVAPSWVVPDTAHTALWLAVALVIAVLSIGAARAHRRPGRDIADRGFAFVALLAVAGTAISLLFALVTSGRALSIDGRTLLPAQLPAVALFAAILPAAWPRRLAALPRGIVPLGLTVALLAAFVGNGLTSEPGAAVAAATAPTDHPSDPQLADLARAHSLVFSNSPTALYSATGGVGSAAIPFERQPGTGAPNGAFAAGMDQLRDLLVHRDVLVVLFPVTQALDDTQPAADRLVVELDLVRVAHTARADVYQRAGTPPA